MHVTQLQTHGKKIVPHRGCSDRRRIDPPATAVVCYRLRVHGSAASLPSNVGITNSLEFCRAQLGRQRDLLRSVWLWFLLPFVPGFVVGLAGYARAQPSHRPATIVYGVLVLILGIGLHVLNHRAAARLQRVLDRLKDNG